jgi:hypothetical protein
MEPEEPAPLRRRKRRRGNRLQYDDSDEPHLVYDSARQKRYERAVPSAPLPLSNRSLLRQLTDFLAFIEDVIDAALERVQYDFQEEEEDEDSDDDASFYARLVQEAQAKLAQANEASGNMVVESTSAGADPVNSAAMLEVAWRWHNAICERGEPLTGLYAHCLMLSWSAFCKLFFCVVYENEQLYRLIRTHRADQYAYCARVSAEENVVVSDARLCDYTVQEVWLSLQQIVPSLYRNAFTTHMKTYLYALFFRYCDLQCTQQPEPRRCMDNPLFVKFARGAHVRGSESSSESEDDEDDESGDDSGESGESESDDDSEEDEADDEVEDYDAYKRVTVPLYGGCALRAAYFFEGQLAFLSQLKRVLLSETLAHCVTQSPLRLAHGAPSQQTLTHCTGALTQMVDALFRHDLLKQFIKEEFRRRVLSLYVYHGETERFRARWPHASHSPGDVLALLRPGDNQSAMTVLKMTARELLAEPQRYERELVLMTKCATRQWLAMAVGDEPLVARIDAGFLMEELSTLRVIDAHVAALAAREPDGGEPHPVPMLLRLVRQYYVARRTTGALYCTASFTEAYLLWLKLLVTDGHLRASHMHADVKSCLSHFKVA